MTLLQVPCVAVVENMSYFEVDGVRHLPFGAGSGDRIVRDFGLPNLVRFPIIADLSAAGDGEPHHLLCSLVVLVTRIAVEAVATCLAA